MRKALCGLALCCGALAAEPALLKYVPANAGVLIGINLKQLRASEFGRSVLAQVNAQRGRGVEDPLRDAEEMLVALPAKKPDGRELVLVSAPCDKAREQRWKKQAAGAAVECLNPWLLAVGQPAAIRAVAGAPPQEAATPLLARARAIAAGNDLWLVAQVPADQYAGELPVQGELLKAVRQVSAGVKFGPTLLVAADLGTRDANDAAALTAALQMLTTMAAQQRGGAFSPLLQKLDLRPVGNSVKVSLAVAQEDLAQAFRTAMQGMFQPPPPTDTGVTVYSSPSDMGVVKIEGAKPQ